MMSSSSDCQCLLAVCEGRAPAGTTQTATRQTPNEFPACREEFESSVRADQLRCNCTLFHADISQTPCASSKPGMPGLLARRSRKGTEMKLPPRSRRIAKSSHHCDRVATTAVQGKHITAVAQCLGDRSIDEAFGAVFNDFGLQGFVVHTAMERRPRPNEEMHNLAGSRGCHDIDRVIAGLPILPAKRHRHLVPGIVACLRGLAFEAGRGRLPKILLVELSGMQNDTLCGKERIFVVFADHALKPRVRRDDQWRVRAGEMAPCRVDEHIGVASQIMLLVLAPVVAAHAVMWNALGAGSAGRRCLSSLVGARNARILAPVDVALLLLVGEPADIRQ